MLLMNPMSKYIRRIFFFLPNSFRNENVLGVNSLHSLDSFLLVCVSSPTVKCPFWTAQLVSPHIMGEG